MGRAKEWVVQQKNLLQRIGAVALALALWRCWLWPWGSSCWCLPPSLWSSGWEPSGKRMGFGPPFGSPFGRLSPGSCWVWGFGLGFGALAGRFPLFEILFRPWAVMIKSIPVASFIIICLIWMSSARLSIFISFLMVLPIIYSNVLQSIHSVDRQMLEAVKVFRLSWPKRVLYLWLPQLKPYLLSACGVSLGISWKAGIAAEIIGIPAGSIGRMFYDAKVYFNTVDLFAWTVIVVVISVLFEKKASWPCFGQAFERWRHCE